MLVSVPAIFIVVIMLAGLFQFWKLRHPKSDRKILCIQSCAYKHLYFYWDNTHQPWKVQLFVSLCILAKLYLSPDMLES